MEKLNIANGSEQLWFDTNFDTRSIDVYHYSSYHETRTKLVSWRGNDKIPGGVWEGENHINKNQFFRFAKEYPKSIRKKLNLCKNELTHNATSEQDFSKTWNCFKRRVSIKVKKLLK
jgi:hypothetical protein